MICSAKSDSSWNPDNQSESWVDDDSDDSDENLSDFYEKEDEDNKNENEVQTEK